MLRNCKLGKLGKLYVCNVELYKEIRKHRYTFGDVTVHSSFVDFDQIIIFILLNKFVAIKQMQRNIFKNVYNYNYAYKIFKLKKRGGGGGCKGIHVAAYTPTSHSLHIVWSGKA